MIRRKLCRLGFHRWEGALFVTICGCETIPGEMCGRCDAERPEWKHEHRGEWRA